ncbi:MAG: DUF1223 domain-containing protein [Rhodospirillales bacterium]|jgi:hypothetical protein
MTHRKTLFAALFAGFLAHPVAAADRPVVVELFTSQGCSSCPPADALLGELAQRKDVLALAYHVDYWDRLGWKDPYSSAAATRRQRQYGDQFRLRAIYTPQIVVDGRAEMVGSDRRAVARAIQAAAQATAAPAPRFDIDLVREANDIRVHVGADAALAGARVQLVGYVRGRTTRVTAGENAGRTLAEANIVVSSEILGEGAGEWRVPAAADRAYAVLVQAPDGRILGAAALAP